MSAITTNDTPTPVAAVSFGEAFRVWLRIGLLSFGGPAGQIAMMHRVLIDEKKWISEARFLHALNYCMLLPGPEAQQLAVYIGWLMHRTLGGLVAGILFVLPGALVILVLSILYAGFRELTLIQALFFGIKAAVLAVVIEAVIRIGKRALKNHAMYSIAAAAFIAIFFLEAPFPVIVVAAAVIGFIGGLTRPDLFVLKSGHGDASGADQVRRRTSRRRSRFLAPRCSRWMSASFWPVRDRSQMKNGTFLSRRYSRRRRVATR